MRKNTLYIFFILIYSVSCNIINPEEEIPAYIRINNVNLITDVISEGSNNHKISDVWVNLNGYRQGTYELPVTFPVLDIKSKNELIFRPGIKINGIAASRDIYPFYTFYTIDTILTRDAITEITPVFKYKSDTRFSWMENFEDAGISLVKSPLSDTTISIINDTLSGSNVAFFNIDNIKRNFKYYSADSFLLPKNASPIYLELDYRSEDYLSLGIKYITFQYATEEPVITLFPHPNGMNKIYIDLTFLINSNSQAYAFGFFFSATRQGDGLARYWIDNIKLVHF